VTELEATNAALTLWRDGWEELHPADTSDPDSVPWTTDDEVFDPTAAGALGALGCWVRIVFRPATDQQLTQGPVAMNEATGVLIVQLFGPLNEGTAKLTGLADDVRTVLKRKRVGELRTLDAASSKPADDGTWAMRIVTVEVRYTYTA
jgi:hypothetical protein